MALKIQNTLSREMEVFQPYKLNRVNMYCCGPTVYWHQHIGNMRAFTEWDVVTRSLRYMGYEVNRIINFTDVGHMTADEDFGEDKMEIAAKKEGKTPREVADFYITHFLDDLSALNIQHPDGSPVSEGMNIADTKSHGWVRASEHIDDMIAHNKLIEANGYTYETDQALYFDVTKLPDYTALSKQPLEDKKTGARDEVHVDPDKRHPADFVLWMKKVGKYENHLQHWESPWGVGFPGWHIECSAMSMRYLNGELDIHTGGIEHITVHHTNERAQNIGAHGHPAVKYWIHNEHLQGADGGKMAKSSGKIYLLKELVEEGFDPMDLRYLYVSISYRMPIKFSLEAVEGARNSRNSLIKKIIKHVENSSEEGNLIKPYRDRFVESLEDDFNLSKGLAVINEMLGSDEKSEDIVATVYDFDSVLGLRLEESVDQLIADHGGDSLPDDVMDLLSDRLHARTDKDFTRSDELRDEIACKGYRVLDTDEGQVVEKI